MKVAIPALNDDVAPCFEAAARFELRTIEESRVTDKQTVECAGCEGCRRIHLLRFHEVDLLLCNGINRVYAEMLRGSDIEVLANVAGNIDSILEQLADGTLPRDSDIPCGQQSTEAIPLEELICWARQLFECHGYTVEDGPGGDSFLIDFIARLSCPVCNRDIRVAVCCGVHMYDTAREIKEFHHMSSGKYDAAVFVRPTDSCSAKGCREFGIELLSPEDELALAERDTDRPIPLLSQPIAGHEKAFVGESGPDAGR